MSEVKIIYSTLHRVDKLPSTSIDANGIYELLKNDGYRPKSTRWSWIDGKWTINNINPTNPSEVSQESITELQRLINTSQLSVSFENITNKPTTGEGYGIETIGGDRVTIDASGFNGNLDDTITDVQKLAQAVDDLVAGGGGANIRRADYQSLISYNGYAPENSLESDAVWTITKITTDVSGNVVSSTQSINIKWTERSLL